jgi:hypothetical protein
MSLHNSGFGRTGRGAGGRHRMTPTCNQRSTALAVRSTLLPVEQLIELNGATEIDA